MPMDKIKIIKSLRTVRGQINGILVMLDKDKNSIKISTQLLSAIAILKRVNLAILKNYFTNCITKPPEFGTPEECDEKLEIAFNVLERIR